MTNSANFSFLVCPYCHNKTLHPTQRQAFGLPLLDRDGHKYILNTVVYLCADRNCSNTAVRTHLYKISSHRVSNSSFLNGEELKDSDVQKTWNIHPSSSYKVFPDYVPDQIRKDYQEAHQIKEISPNASATLARRCLQGMIRGRWNIKKGNLRQEIEALREKKEVDRQTLKAIDVVREFGNIGAHMKEDANLIIDVDEKEADQLISLIELLIENWYIATHEKNEKLEELGNLRKEKE